MIVRSLQVLFYRENAPIIGAIDWHSYSQLILRPYGTSPCDMSVCPSPNIGWTRADSPDEVQLKSIGDKMKEAIFAVLQPSNMVSLVL